MEYPKKNDLVIGEIKKILPYGAFCILPEYGNMEAFLHISEVAPRWIKNIHEFISEKQTVVARVTRLDPQKQQIDISLKRVNEAEKKEKIEGVKREKRAKKFVMVALKNLKSKTDAEKIFAEIKKVYEDPLDFFEDLRDEEKGTEKVDITEKLLNEFIGIAKKYLKKPIVTVTKKFNLHVFGPEGVEHLKEAMKDIDVLYLGPGNYSVKSKGQDPKALEQELRETIKKIDENLGAIGHVLELEEDK
ncbi:S1 RNA-binding domain-containing protein [Candidatus Micrarchaeota archaeon]|nr:S1 RNA-binding domain-containing protein [Candidatus Micrarchaeota archaeon]